MSMRLVSLVPMSRIGAVTVLTAALSVSSGAGDVSGDSADGIVPATPAVSSSDAEPDTVTLITGDVVDVTSFGDGRHAVDPRPRTGTEQIAFDVLETPDGDVYVIPSDAHALVTSGHVDRELFNVTRLVDEGHADEDSDRLPVIVQYRNASIDAHTVTTELPGAAGVVPLASIDGAGVALEKNDLSSFWQAVVTTSEEPARSALTDGVSQVWLDRQVRTTLDTSVPQVGGPSAWDSGLDGTGIRVAVLDTGVDTFHPDLVEQIEETQSFVPGQTVADAQGHGTHVASIVLGTGAASGGRFTGVAPGARLLAGKVLDDGGNGQMSWVIAGMEWAVAEGAPVVNMSLSSDEMSDGTDPLSRALDELSSAHGVLFVVAAGNAGPHSIGSPSAAASALTVGAVDPEDELAYFSSTGPLTRTFGLKPDITAPGFPIVAAQARDTDFGAGPAPDGYAAASGTSMAAPHVAGAAAILAQQRPDWNADQIKAALTGSALPHPHLSAYEQGAGRLDIAGAIDQHLLPSPAAVDFGSLPAPWEQPAVKEVTLANHGDTAMTVNLVAEVQSPAETPVLDAVTVEPAALTVPAGATASVRVTYHPSAGVEGGFTGHLRATDASGDGVLQMALAAHQTPPGHTLRLRPLPPEGWPSETIIAEGTPWVLVRVDAPQEPITVQRQLPYADVFVPDGVYSVTTRFAHYHPVTGDLTSTWLVDPEVVVDGADTELVINGGAAVPVTLDTPRPSDITGVSQAWSRETAYGGAYTTHWGVGWGNSRSTLQVTPTDPVTTGGTRLFTRISATEATLRVRTADPGGPALEASWPHYFYQQPRLSGEHDVDLVDVGTGTAEEIAGTDVEGKLALVSANRWDAWLANEVAGPLRDAQHRLADAGAAAAVIFLHEHAPAWCPPPTAPGGCSGGAVQETALPVIRIGPGEGEELRRMSADGPVPMRVTSSDGDPSYGYQLLFEDDRIPDPPNFRATDDDLATVTHRFRSSVPTGLFHNIHSLMPDGPAMNGGLLTSGPAARTEYVGPALDGVLWVHALRDRPVPGSHTPEPDHPRWTETTPAIHGAGEQRTMHWGQTATAGNIRLPADLEAAPLRLLLPFWEGCVFCRDGRNLTASPHMVFGDGTRFGDNLYLLSVTDPSRFDSRLYRNGDEVARNGALPSWDLSDYPEAAEYRLTHRVRPWYLEHPTEIATEWVFTSEAPDRDDSVPNFECLGQRDTDPVDRLCRPERALVLAYDLDPMMNLNETVAAPGATAVTITVFPQMGAPAVPIAGLDVQVSYDGEDTWVPAPATARVDGVYDVLLRHPAGTESVSLRATAWDDDGNRVEQTLTDLYPLADRCDTVIDRMHVGPLQIDDGVTCVAEGARVIGPVTVGPGGGLVATDAQVLGPVTADGATTVQLRDTLLNGPLTITGTTMSLALDGNRIAGPVALRGNTTGELPVVLAGNHVTGVLTCLANEPRVVDVGIPNRVTGPVVGTC